MNYEKQTRFEASRAKHSIFVTLTYAPEYLPTATLSVSHDGLRTNVDVLSACDRVEDHFGDVVTSFELFDVEEEFLMCPFNYHKFNIENNAFGFLFYPDVQKFNKRLRYYMKDYLSRYLFNDKSFKQINDYEKKIIKKMVSGQRFFCIGEYGPKTFRPHWHFLFFCDTTAVSEALYDSVHKAWPYGRIDRQYSTGGACSYVSSYLNSSSSLPLVLRNTFPTKVRHSKHYGFEDVKEYFEQIEEVTYQGLRERSLSYGGKIHALPVPVALEAALYPKCYQFGEANDTELYRRYTAYNAFRSQYPNCSVNEMVLLYLSHEYRDDWFANLYHEDILIPDTDKPESTLRTLLYTSRKFFRNLDITGLSAHSYINIIKNYYNEKTSYALSHFYEDMQEKYAYTDPVLQINEYNNVARDYDDFSKEIKHRALHRLSNFLPATPLYEVLYQNKYPEKNMFFLCSFQDAERIYKNRVKHKVQNDANGIFTNQ